MTPRQLLGQYYRRLFIAAAPLAGGRLPVRFHAHWMWWPTPMWPGFRCAYEPYMAAALRKLLTPGMGFADIGAHHGLWAGLARVLVGKQGAVIACEPSPAYDTLAAHLQGASNVRLVRAAAGAEDGSKTFYSQGEATSGSVLETVTKINQQFMPAVEIKATSVPMVTLDALLGHPLDRRWLVKVDVEGYEAEVLRGAGKLIASEMVDWLIEVHPLQLKLSGVPETDVLGPLERAGYMVRVIDRNPNSLYTVFATKHTGRLAGFPDSPLS